MPMHSAPPTLRRRFCLSFAVALALSALPVTGLAQQLAYFADRTSQSILIVDTATNTKLMNTIAIGQNPMAIAVRGARAYVANSDSGSVTVIDTETAQPVTTIMVGNAPEDIVVSPTADRAYVARRTANQVSVIDTSTNLVVGPPIAVGFAPVGLAITPDGSVVLVSNNQSNSVSYINTTTNMVFGTNVTVGTHPEGIAITRTRSTRPRAPTWPTAARRASR